MKLLWRHKQEIGREMAVKGQLDKGVAAKKGRWPGLIKDGFAAKL